MALRADGVGLRRNYGRLGRQGLGRGHWLRRRLGRLGAMHAGKGTVDAGDFFDEFFADHGYLVLGVRLG